MPSHEAAIISEARRVARCQRRIATLKRQLKEASAELRTAKRNLRALVGKVSDPMNQLPPVKGFDS